METEGRIMDFQDWKLRAKNCKFKKVTCVYDKEKKRLVNMEECPIQQVLDSGNKCKCNYFDCPMKGWV
jgi:hypothetical protein